MSLWMIKWSRVKHLDQISCVLFLEDNWMKMVSLKSFIRVFFSHVCRYLSYRVNRWSSCCISDDVSVLNRTEYCVKYVQHVWDEDERVLLFCSTHLLWSLIWETHEMLGDAYRLLCCVLVQAVNKKREKNERNSANDVSGGEREASHSHVCHINTIKLTLLWGWFCVFFPSDIMSLLYLAQHIFICIVFVGKCSGVLLWQIVLRWVWRIWRLMIFSFTPPPWDTTAWDLTGDDSTFRLHNTYVLSPPETSMHIWIQCLL